jgi:Xaa-Pro aminopeptidase
VITREVALGKVQQALKDNDLDAIVAVSPWNTVYTAGVSFLTQRTIPERLGMVVIGRDREPIFVYCTIEEGHVIHESWVKERRGYTEFADKPIDVLADVLREIGVANGRVGIEKRFLVAQNYDELQEQLPDGQLVEADSIFDKMRAVKTPEEIELLGKTAMWTDEAIRTAFEQYRPGDTERTVGDRMVDEARKHGAEGLLHLVLATGPNLYKIHHAPDDTPLQPGGAIRTDFGMFWGFYVSDVARTVFVKQPTQAQLDAYKNLEEIHQTVIAAMKPGVRASELYNICKQSFEKRGVPFAMPHIGHSIGLGVHEFPMMHPFNHHELEPGTVLMLEPLIEGPDGYYHTEDMILITETGHEVLSRSADWSQPMIVG